jgi:hypothetical protein
VSNDVHGSRYSLVMPAVASIGLDDKRQQVQAAYRRDCRGLLSQSKGRLDDDEPARDVLDRPDLQRARAGSAVVQRRSNELSRRDTGSERNGG